MASLSKCGNSQICPSLKLVSNFTLLEIEVDTLDRNDHYHTVELMGFISSYFISGDGISGFVCVRGQQSTCCMLDYHKFINIMSSIELYKLLDLPVLFFESCVE